MESTELATGQIQVTDDGIEVQGLKYFKRLLPLLSSLHTVGCQRDAASNRQLFFDDYCKLVLLYLFNPLIRSVRMLQEASALQKVSQALGIQRFSLGSFSEAPAVFDPEELKAIIAELAGELKPLATDPRLSDLKHLITLADGTILRALPKLAQTLFNRDRSGQALHGWRLHTHLVLGSPIPERIDRTSAKGGSSSERKHLMQHLQPDRCYVIDRGYHDAKVLNAIHAVSSSYVCRSRDNLVPQAIEERPITAAAAEACVIRDALVSISTTSKQPSDHPLRLIVIQGTPHPKRRARYSGTHSNGRIYLLTNLLDAPAELIVLIYRYRWTIELFFRLLKQILGCRHLLSQRPEGIDIQIYCAVIAAMLIHLQTGRKPTKALVFVLGLYLAGWASEQEVLAVLSRPDHTGVKRRAKDELWKKLGVN